MDDGAMLPIVYVERNPGDVAGRLEFDKYQPDSDLLAAPATLDAKQQLTNVGAGQSLLANCGVNQATADVQAPDVRNDGSTVVFAMRTSSASPLTLWTVNVDGSNCKQLTTAQPDVGGIKIHDFDPAWSPDGQYVVFASTRGGAGGPGKTRKYFRPQADLWRVTFNGASAPGAAEQMTFLTNSEISPQFMREGRVTMSTEKVSSADPAGFYQLAGRRINWDLTDYHPLLGQRATSGFADGLDASNKKSSIGYQMVSDIRELPDGNFAIILADDGAKSGGGTLATFNRSVGPMELDRNDSGFLKSMKVIDPAATGRLAATNGAYRSPVGLPSGQIMVSHAPVTNLAAGSFDWDIVAIDQVTGARTTLIGGAKAQLDAVLAYKYPARTLYENRRQLVFGGGVGNNQDTRAVLHMPDAPMLFTLFTSNLRRGRAVESFRKATYLAVYSEDKAPTSAANGTGPGGIFESRKLLGKAKLASDGSVKISIPARTGLVFQLEDDSGGLVVSLGEEHQVGPGETITMGVSEKLFDAVCGGCHGSVSGKELDVNVTPDALTGASMSKSAAADAFKIGN
jgi:hypothetical protein